MKGQKINNPPRVLQKRLFNIRESAVYLGRTVWSVREMIWAGKIDYIRDGRRIFLDIHDMDTWIEHNRTKHLN